MATLVLLFLSTSASGYTIVLTPTNTVRLQTFAPVREPGTTRDYAPTLPRPGTLPETWVVPDTFTFPTKKTKEPNVYRLTLFKSSKHKAEYMEAALIETIGIEATKANEIAKQAQMMVMVEAAMGEGSGVEVRAAARVETVRVILEWRAAPRAATRPVRGHAAPGRRAAATPR